MEKNTSIGYLTVRVTAADGAIPIEGAQVLVTDGETGSGIRLLFTDRSGLTERIPLPSPLKEASQSPGKGPVSRTYNIRTAKEGYYTVSDIQVPIYPGVTSVQPVAMIPVEYGSNGSYRVNPKPDDIYFDEGRSPNL